MKKKTQVDEIPDMLEEESSLETPKENSNNEAMSKSRMKRRLETQSKRSLILTVFGIIVIICGLLIWGPNAVIQFSLLLSKANTNSDSQKTSDTMLYIAPPVLDPLPKATNSATIVVSGQISGQKEGKIRLYVNDNLADVADIKKSSFSFKDVTLKEGKNELKAQVVLEKQKSNFSNIEQISYLKEPPELTVDEPSEGDRYSGNNSRTIVVRGKTAEGASVRVNDFIAVTKTNGSFSYTLALKDGDNTIKVVAIDEAGNKTEKEIKVNYSP